VQHAEHALARAGLVAQGRMTWPGVTLTILAYLGMLVEALFIVFALIDGDWPALIATGVALAATIATIIVTAVVMGDVSFRPRGRSASTSRGCGSTSRSARPIGCGCCSRRAAPSCERRNCRRAQDPDAPLARFHLHERAASRTRCCSGSSASGSRSSG
jgi:hypothetical protein